MVKNRYNFFLAVDGLKVTAHVLLVRDSLHLYVTFVPINISETYVILHSLHPRLSISMWMQLFQNVYHGNNSFLINFPQS